MSSTYAIVENGIVTNVILWDGESSWTPGAAQAIPVPLGTSAGIGDTYNGSTFVALVAPTT